MVAANLAKNIVPESREALRAAFSAIDARLDTIEGAAGYKGSVRAATTTALAAYTRTSNVITADAVGALGTIDGVADLAEDDYILLKDGANARDNGRYVITTLGDGATAFVLTRAPEMDASAEIVAGNYIFVSEGTANGNAFFVLTTNDPITINSTALTFTKLPTLADLASTATGLGDALIGVTDPDSTITATTQGAANAELSKRLLGAAATTTAIKALAAAKRADGGLVVDLATYEVWEFDADSSATASANVLVPDAGTGRWVRPNGPPIRVFSKTVGFADITDAGATKAIDFASACPAGTFVLGGGVNVTAAFDNAGDSASGTVDLGIKSGDTDCILDGASLDAVAEVGTPLGVRTTGLFGAFTAQLNFAFDVNLNTLTKGACTAYVVTIPLY